jgi:hypothetical protein
MKHDRRIGVDQIYGFSERGAKLKLEGVSACAGELMAIDWLHLIYILYVYSDVTETALSHAKVSINTQVETTVDVVL